MRVTVVAPNVYTEFGISAPIGSTITVGDDYGASLVWSLKAIDTDGVLSEPGNHPFDQVPPQSPVSGGGIPPTIAIMGDSIASQNSSISGGVYATRGQGPVIWMLSYLGHPWDFQPSDNFAVAGTTLDLMIANQLPALLAAHTARRYQRCFISAGTNDTNAGRAIADIQADFLTLFRALRGAGIIPVHTCIRPRGIDGAITTAKQANMRLNEWLYLQWLSGLIEYIPVSEVYADTSTAFGNAVAALMYDGGTVALHPSARGAALEGKVMADYYSYRGVQPGLAMATQQGDVFDRTNNPAGVAFASANPLLIGGTTTPTGMTTSGGTWSNVGGTLPNGQTRANRSCALAASTTHYLYDDWTKVGAWSASDLQPGDIIEARALVILSGVVNVNSVAVRLAENNGSGNLTHLGLSPTETANLQGDHVLYLKTPRIPVRGYAGSGNASIFARADIVTDAGASGTAIVRALEVRKVD